MPPKQHFSRSPHCHPDIPTPDAFGEPLDLGNWSTYKDSFLHVFPRRLTMTTEQIGETFFKRMVPPLIISLSVLFRIDSYREYLLSTSSTHNHDDQSHPLPNWHTASGATSVTNSPTIIGDGGREKTAGAGLEQFSVKSTHGLLVLEDVDEDAEDADATTRDELIMLAHDNPIWMEELRRFLQEEEKEKEQMQNERVARLIRWREDMAIQPT
ncbi:hypothetical protein F5887DRAFT_947840 [Amanita rubescens]|nr:hypothetical protein F5887DRAFT_947840 [Amanita rubescens]